MEATVQTGDPGDDQGASASKVMVLEPTAVAASPVTSPCVRLVLQQCMSAQLMVQPAGEGAEPQFVEASFLLILQKTTTTKNKNMYCQFNLFSPTKQKTTT